MQQGIELKNSMRKAGLKMLETTDLDKLTREMLGVISPQDTGEPLPNSPASSEFVPVPSLSGT